MKRAQALQGLLDAAGVDIGFCSFTKVTGRASSGMGHDGR